MSSDPSNTSPSQPNEAIANEFKRVLNTHGYPFQEAVLRRIGEVESEWEALSPTCLSNSPTTWHSLPISPHERRLSDVEFRQSCDSSWPILAGRYVCPSPRSSWLRGSHRPPSRNPAAHTALTCRTYRAGSRQHESPRHSAPPSPAAPPVAPSGPDPPLYVVHFL